MKKGGFKEIVKEEPANKGRPRVKKCSIPQKNADEEVDGEVTPEKIDVEGDDDNDDIGLEHSFFYEVRGLKLDSVRSATICLLRDDNVSKRKETIAKNDNSLVSHDYFLRERTPKSLAALEVDHTLECQLISHCIMQTKELHPLLKQINILNKKKDQTEVVKAFLNPIYDIQNGANQSPAGTFNLHLLEKSVNVLKGSATTDFIRRQYSEHSGEKGGPVNFEKYFKQASGVVQGRNDADMLAGNIEKLVQNIEYKYTDNLLHLSNNLATKKDHDKRMLALTETINQVFDKMFEGNKSR